MKNTRCPRLALGQRGFPGLPHAVDGVDHDVGEEHDIQHLIRAMADFDTLCVAKIDHQWQFEFPRDSF